MIDVSEGTDIDKTNASKECDVLHYWYFLNNVFRFEPQLSNGCDDLIQKAMTFIDVATVSVKGSDYRIQFWHMGKDGAISMINNHDLN